MDTNAFWKRVKILLKERNIIQADAAKACEISISTFRGWMAKGISPPLVDAVRIARFLGVSLEYIISGPLDSRNAKINRDVLTLLKMASEKLNKTAH